MILSINEFAEKIEECSKTAIHGIGDFIEDIRADLVIINKTLYDLHDEETVESLF